MNKFLTNGDTETVLWRLEDEEPIRVCKLDNGEFLEYDLCTPTLGPFEGEYDHDYPNHKYIGSGVIYSLNTIPQKDLTTRYDFFKRT